MTTLFEREISCRVTRTLLMYVRERRNGSLESLLEDLDVDEDFLLDTDNWVSHSFLQVFYDRMIAILEDEGAVYKMTLASQRLQSLGILDRIVRLLGWPRLVYSQAPKYNRLLKRNGDVHIRELGDAHVLLEDRFHDSTCKTRHDCDYTRGILAGIPTMFGLPPASVTEIECQVATDIYGQRRWDDHPNQDAAGCLYRVEWINPGPFNFFKRLFNRRRLYQLAVEDLQEANRKIQEKYEESKRIANDLETTNRKLVRYQEQIDRQAAEIRVSEEKYRIIAENVTDTIWRIDLETMAFDYISPSVEKTRGFTPEEAKSLGIEGTLSPESLKEITRILAGELERDGEPGVDPDRSRTVEVRQSCKDGTYMWAEARVTFIRNESGRPVGILGVSRDIDERKRVETALKESEQRYRHLFTHAPAGIVEADYRTGKFTDANEVVCGYLGYSKAELLEMGPWDILTKDSVPAFNERLEKRLSGKPMTDSFEYKVRTRDGGEIWVLTNARDIYQKNKVVGSTAVLHDITEKKKAEQALKESEERFKLLSDKAPFGIALIDEKGIYRYINAKFTEMFGYTLTDLPDGKSWFKKAYPDPEYRKEVIGKWLSGFKTGAVGELRSGIFLVTCQNGDKKEIDFRSVTLQEWAELVFYEDITNKRKMEAQLRQTQKMEAIGVLAGGIAHDFNNILSGIIGYTEFSLQEAGEGTLLEANMLKVLKAGERARDLIRQILMFSRLDDRDFIPTRLEPIILEVLKLLRASLPASVVIHEQLRDNVIIKADPTQIHQVLLNLSTNASHAMEKKGGTLTVRTRVFTPDAAFLRHHSDLTSGNYVQISVSDTGPGIDPSVKDRIFDPYFTTKAPGKGTGMGLSVVHGIVKTHGGAITVHSTPGQGATFHVFLPVFAGLPAETTEKKEKLPKGSEHVLWIDDEPMQLEIGHKILNQLGYTVTTQASAIDSLKLIEKDPRRFDLIITDMTMPRMTGDQLARRILAIDPDKAIIMCTGFHELMSESKAMAMGIRGFIMKPITMQAVALTVRSVLDTVEKRDKPPKHQEN